MLPLSAETTPTTASEFTEALTRGLREHGLTPRQIEAQGSAFPKMETVRIDLTEAHATRDVRPPQPPTGHAASVEIAHFELVGTPIYFEKAALEVRLIADGVKAGMALTDGRGSLVLESAASGHVSVQMTRAALEALLHSLAAEIAAKQGLEVKQTRLSFTQEGPLAISFRAEVTAKIFVMNATLALTGRVVVDNELNARISDLALDGDGMILKLAGGFARPHLDRLEGRVFPLLAFAPGGLKLRNIELTAGETLRARAEFGTA